MKRIERTERSGAISLAIAMAVHVAAFVAARHPVVCAVPHAEKPPVTIQVDEIPIDSIELRAEETREPRAVAPPTSGAIEPPRLAAVARRRETLNPNTTPTESPVVPEPPPVVSIAPAASVATPPVTLAQLGIEGPNRFVVARSSVASGPTAQESSEDVRRSIDDALLKHDRSVGLGSEGPAIAVIEDIVVASTAAVNGRAVLSVVANALGIVTAVTCVDGDHAAWDTIAADVANALRSKRLRAAPGGRGVAMRIEVTSREQMPSGRDPGVEVRAFHFIPLKHGRGPRSTRVDILDVKPEVVVDLRDPDEDPSVGQASPVRFPRAHIQVVKIFGIDGDLADVGAKPRRVVHAKVIDETTL